MLTPGQRYDLYQAIAPRLDEIARLFKNPKITLLVRAPDLGDGDFIMTEDGWQEILNAVARLAASTKGESALSPHTEK